MKFNPSRYCKIVRICSEYSSDERTLCKCLKCYIGVIENMSDNTVVQETVKRILFMIDDYILVTIDNPSKRLKVK